jgi:hypothetical protein
VTRDRVLHVAAGILGDETPDGLSYYQIAELPDKVLSEMVTRLNLDQQEIAT